MTSTILASLGLFYLLFNFLFIEFPIDIVCVGIFVMVSNKLNIVLPTWIYHFCWHTVLMDQMK